MRDVLWITGALGGIVGLGIIAPSNFMTTLTTFTLAGIVGYKVRVQLIIYEFPFDHLYR